MNKSYMGTVSQSANGNLRKVWKRRSAVRSILMGAVASMVGLPAMSARAAIIYDIDTPLTIASTYAIGQPSTGLHTDAVTAGAVYSNQTTFSGYGVDAGANGTTKYTALLADDINTIATAPFLLSTYTFSITNLATSAQTISPYIRFYDTTGTGGGPGNLIAALNYNGISIAAGTVNGFTSNVSANAITLPTSFWACEFFSTTGTAANAKLIGEGTFNPVDIGTSADEDFTSSTVGTSNSSFLTAGPAGTVNVSPYAGAPVANFEFEFNPASVPEPASMSMCLGAVGSFMRLARRRRVSA